MKTRGVSFKSRHDESSEALSFMYKYWLQWNNQVFFMQEEGTETFVAIVAAYSF